MEKLFSCARACACARVCFLDVFEFGSNSEWPMGPCRFFQERLLLFFRPSVAGRAASRSHCCSKGGAAFRTGVLQLAMHGATQSQLVNSEFQLARPTSIASGRFAGYRVSLLCFFKRLSAMGDAQALLAKTGGASRSAAVNNACFASVSAPTYL